MKHNQTKISLLVLLLLMCTPHRTDAMQAIFSAIKIAVKIGAELGKAAATAGNVPQTNDFDAEIRNDLDARTEHSQMVHLFETKVIGGNRDNFNSTANPTFKLKNEQFTTYFNLYHKFCFRNREELLNPKPRKDYIDAECPGRWPYVPYKPGDSMRNYPSLRFTDMLILPVFPNGLKFGDPALTAFLENEEPERYYKEWAENAVLAGEAFREKNESAANIYAGYASEALKRATGNYSGNRRFNQEQMKHIQEQKALAMKPLEERAKKVIAQEEAKIASIAAEASTDWAAEDKWPDGDKGKWWTLKPRPYFFEQYAQFALQAQEAESNGNTAQSTRLKAQAEQMAQVGAGMGNALPLDGAPPQTGSAPLAKAEMEKRKAAALKALIDEETKKGAEMKEEATAKTKEAAAKKTGPGKATKQSQGTATAKKGAGKPAGRQTPADKRITAKKAAEEAAAAKKKADEEAAQKAAEEEARKKAEEADPEQPAPTDEDSATTTPVDEAQTPEEDATPTEDTPQDTEPTAPAEGDTPEETTAPDEDAPAQTEPTPADDGD